MIVDNVTAGCLSRISRGDVAAVGVLADHLEENALVGAKTVRGYWQKYVGAVEWTNEADFSRRKKTKWENVALWRRWLRNRIAKLYGRKWKKMDLKKLV